MNKIEAIIAKLDSVNEQSLEKGLLNIIDEKKNEALDLNLEQLYSGRDAKDQTLGRYRNPAYAEFKRSLNPKGVVDLKLTGAFYHGFYAKTDNFPVQFGSTDSKAEMLAEKYGQEIFGLDAQNLEEFRKEIKPELQEYIKGLLQV